MSLTVYKRVSPSGQQTNIVTGESSALEQYRKKVPRLEHGGHYTRWITFEPSEATATKEDLTTFLPDSEAIHLQDLPSSKCTLIAGGSALEGRMLEITPPLSEDEIRAIARPVLAVAV